MKRLLKSLFCCMVAVVVCANFAACSLFDSSDDTIYTIQYTDDSGTHQIEVQNGDLYTLESIPERTGYTFLGLYDAETGGTQYVNSSGSAVSAFSDKQNIVLYPQYQANEYTLVLDYGEASVTGSRQYAVTYGESLPELPTNLTVEHKVFSGWYTQENCGGTQVADGYSLIPVVSVVNEDNFEITDSTKYIYLYAGFTTQSYTVTFNFGSGIDTETMKVEYGTSISDIVPTTRNDEGYAVLSWSLTSGGSEYTGTITEDTTLYALEWAPCIDFNSNGGDSVTSIVAKAGSSITLPAATRELYKFMYWTDSEGNESELTTMPSASVTLKAVWQAMIVFDENGGTEVDDISEAAGTAITLPTPEKEGYIFAGWYTSDKTQYTSAKMPSAGIELKAGWYSELTATITQISGDTSKTVNNTSYKLIDSLTLDFSEYLDENFSGSVTIEASLKIRHPSASLSSTKPLGLKFYSTATISDNYLLYTKEYDITSSSYENVSYGFTANIAGNKIYCAAYSYLSVTLTGGYGAYISDYYYVLSYPDTTTLYL